MNLQGNLKLKIIRVKTSLDLDFEVNHWLSENHVSIVKIDFTHINWQDGATYYTAYILYENYQPLKITTIPKDAK